MIQTCDYVCQVSKTIADRGAEEWLGGGLMDRRFLRAVEQILSRRRQVLERRDPTAMGWCLRVLLPYVWTPPVP